MGDRGTVEYLGADKPVNRMEPLVSVCIMAYQHAPYIEQCLQGVLAQQTDFAYEILLGEDESQDGTREICQKYAEDHQDKIRLFLHSRKNNYKMAGKPTGKNNFVYNLNQARGEYLAFSDGDDYWLSPNKLKIQLESFVDNNQSLICFHKSRYIDELTGRHGFISDFGEKRSIMPPGLVIKKMGCAMAMNSIMVRRELIPHLLQYCYEVPGMHFFIQALGVVLSASGAVYLPEVMGVYRRNSVNSISRTLMNTRQGQAEWARRNLRMLDIVRDIAVHDVDRVIDGVKEKLALLVISGGNVSMKESVSLGRQVGVRPVALSKAIGEAAIRRSWRFIAGGFR